MAITKHVWIHALVSITLPTASLAQDLFEGYGFIGNAGISYADGVIGDPPGGGSFFYVSTYGGLDEVGSLTGVGGDGTPTNGSLLTSKIFSANAGNRLVFSFNYLTSDGAGFSDYAWARLSSTSSDAEYLLYTARTTPGGDTVPGFSMPEPNANLTPPQTEIINGAPIWSPLGDSSGACYAIGCGYTGWVRADFEIPEDGEYRLQFGVTNWNDTAFDSGMAIKNLTEDFSPIKPPERTVESFGEVSLFSDRAFDRSLPTVVVTHGWQRTWSGSGYTGTFGSIDFLDDMHREIRSAYGNDVNVLLYSWENAFTGKGDVINNSARPVPFITEVGIDLGQKLAAIMGSDYQEPVHLIGHSYGSSVNIDASTELSLRGIETTHMTVLDAPTHAPFRIGVAEVSYQIAASSSWVNYMDNYFGTADGLFGAYGGPIAGAELNGGYSYLNDNHSDVWKTYRDSVAIGCEDALNGGFGYSAALGDRGCFDRRPQQDPVTFNLEFSDALLEPILFQNGSFDTQTSTASISTGSDGYGIFSLFVPLKSEAFMFDLMFDQIGDGDWLEVLFGDTLLGAYKGLTFGETQRTLAFDFSSFAGTTDFLTLFMAGEGTDQASISASNFRFVTGASALSPTPIPLPASAWLLIGGLGLLLRLRRRDQSY